MSVRSGRYKCPIAALVLVFLLAYLAPCNWSLFFQVPSVWLWIPAVSCSVFIVYYIHIISPEWEKELSESWAADWDCVLIAPANLKSIQDLAPYN
jgi:4-hydroxybenzoate polyprenyltransferase